jgi:hypothetical protein
MRVGTCAKSVETYRGGGGVGVTGTSDESRSLCAEGGLEEEADDDEADDEAPDPPM